MKRLTYLLMAISVISMTSCREKKVTNNDNPFLTGWDTPFGMPPFGDIRPEHFKPAFEEAMRVNNEEIEAIINNTEAPTFDNVILALDNSGQMLQRVNSIFGMINSADSNDEIQAIEKEMSPLLTAHSDNISLNPLLFNKIKAVYDTRESMGLNPVQTRLLEKKYKDFVRAGANLSDADKEVLKRINNELADADVKFRANLLAEMKNFLMVVDSTGLTGLPADVRDAAAKLAEERGEKGKYAFNLDKASMLPFLTYSDRRDLRQKLYMGYLNRANNDNEYDNKAIINDIVRLRLERSKLLGYDTYADFALEDRMAKKPANVYSLLDDLWTPALAGAKNELEEMRAIKVEETGEADFQSWDWWYYAEKVRKQKYNLDEEMLRPYFGLDRVQAGIFELCNKLYGITFRPVVVPVYNPECVTYEVLDADNSHLGILLMDFHPRPGKRVGAWCGAYQARTFENGVKTKDPIVYIVCNFTRPSGIGDAPALLSLDEAETFFHEFGHALHSLFGLSPYRGLRSTERDFVELPSQIMENWAFEPDMLRRYAYHYDTKKVIPEDLIRKIRNSVYFNQGFIMTEYLAASFSDMDIHMIADKQMLPLDVNAYERKILNEKRGLIPQIAPRYRFPYFAHIFGGNYSAGYYSYKWAEVLDKDAYEAFAETGDIFNREIAAKFRTEILEKGGTSDGMTLYLNFRGKEPSRDFLLFSSGLKERPKKETPIVPVIIDDQK